MHRDGGRRWVEERGQAIEDEDGRPRWLDGVMMDLTVRKELEERLAHDAAHDPLTGLPNRTLLVDHLEATLARGERTRTHTAVLFVDLDRFKLVNDALGHTAGDELLVHFTRRLNSVLRDSDMAARTGGDEFVIVCTDLESPTEAETIAGRVADVLADPFTVQGRTVFVTASIGIALAEAGALAGDVLRSADAAAYRAKDRGRNRYEVFDDALRAATTAALEVETDLHRALERHQLFLRYQPVVELTTGRLIGAEALVRWQHPQRGLLTPDQFLPAAEASGLVVAIGREMLDLAAGALAAVPVEALPSINVNMSPRELAQQRPGRPDPRGAERQRRRPAPDVHRDHRERRARRARHRDRDPRRDPRPGRAAGHRRLRDRLLVAQLPAPPPGRHGEDRPVVHDGAQHRQQRRHDRRGHHRARHADSACRWSPRAWRPSARRRSSSSSAAHRRRVSSTRRRWPSTISCASATTPWSNRATRDTDRLASDVRH